MPNWTENKIICKKELGGKLLTKTKDGYNLDFSNNAYDRIIKLSKASIDSEIYY